MNVLVVLCSLTAVAWCQTPTGSTETVVDYLQRNHRNLVNLIEQAGLSDTLKGAGPFTIFAPSESALSSIDSTDTAKLAELLKYHVASGSYKPADLYNEHLLDTLATNQKIRINHYMSVGTYTAEGQQLSTYMHQTSNGIVYTIRNVMTPPPGTVLDIISQHKNLTTLHTAITQAKLENFLQDQNPITLFAPTDAAFNKLGAGAVTALVQNPQLLANVLQYHVIPGSLYKAGYHSASLHSFEEVDKIRLHKFFIFPGYDVDSGSMVGDELSATNGVVHLIDTVLVPKSHASEVQAAIAGAATVAPTTVTATA